MSTDNYSHRRTPSSVLTINNTLSQQSDDIDVDDVIYERGFLVIYNDNGNGHEGESNKLMTWMLIKVLMRGS
ncbi:unnamed protein product [Ambrosiozyma monospora]|uniref:Unnamed protein product n=1 Tax=Ambrosiozyma monospora TaxID=43982 RepID=A0ACB5TSW3_AMBMO|nr:unnamed protein product [Ambrosiozyma monospora]